MERIDWSKAPEGATHRVTRRVTSPHVWVKVRGTQFSAWDSDRGWVDATVSFDDSNFTCVEPRPSTWNGEGLPPVGTVCEVDHYGWRPCEVFAHKSGGGTMDALFSYTDDADATRWWWFDDATRFRPVRTREQVAAEEREKAADELCETIVEHYGAPKMSEHYLGLARALIEAGYRKVDPAK